MRLPRVRFTVRRVMVAVAVVAVNLGLIREAESLTGCDGSIVFVLLSAYALVPSLSLLTVAAVSVGLGLVKRGQAPAFSTGYLLLGGLASFVMCLGLATQVFIPLFCVTVTSPDPIPAPTPSPFEEGCGYILTLAMFALPQVAPALIGGGLAARHGLTIVLSGRAAPTDQATLHR
jgi:hypothetical protein